MEPFRPRTAPRLRSQTHSPDDDDRYQSTTSEEDGGEEGISNTYDCINRRMTFEEAFLKSRGLLASSVSNLSSVPPAMGRTGGRGSLTSSTPNNPLSTLSKGDGKQCKDGEQEYRTSCLVRTPSGALFIPSDIPKGPLSPQHKGDIPITQSTTLQEETKKHPDRCQLSYTSSTSVPTFPVRNNVRRPVSSHFIHSRLHFRKTLSSRCTWKCTAIAFIFLTIALLTALTYFIAVTVLNWQYTTKQPCPVMVEDMGLVDDSKDVKSPSSLPSQTMPPVGESFSEVQIGKKYTQKNFIIWSLEYSVSSE